MRTFLIIIFAFISSSIVAQDDYLCGTTITEEESHTLEKMLKSTNNGRVNASVVNIPIKAHIVRLDDGTDGLTESQLNSAISTANSYYSNADIVFELFGSINYIDDSELFELDASDEGKIAVPNDVRGVINIYFVESLTSGGGNLCGYTYLPPSADRIFMRNSCTTSGNTFAHELGHYFSLYHTHGKTNNGTTDELVNGSNCENAGDNLCDTPADPNLSGKTSGCSYTGGERDANGDPYNPLVADIMSYAPGSCRTLFTQGQYDRIRRGFENGRSYLNFTSPDFAVLFNADKREGCEGLEVRFTSSAFGATQYLWDFPGGDPANSTSENPRVTFNQPGRYTISLTATNNSGETKTFTRTNYIEVIDPLAEAIGDSKSYLLNEAAGLPEELKVENTDLALTFEVSDIDAEGSASSGSITVNNYNYKTETPVNYDYLLFKTVNGNGVRGVSVSFDYAYTYLLGDINQGISPKYDSLSILVDNECEAPPAAIWKQGGEQLATVPATTTEFIPQGPTDWKNNSIYVERTSGVEFIQLALQNISYGGNNLYIDNILIEPDYGVNAPTRLRVINQVDRNVTIEWDDLIVNESGFVIERSTDGMNYQKIDSVAANSIRYTDQLGDLTGDISYRVRAYGLNNNISDPSNEVIAVITNLENMVNESTRGIKIYPNPTQDVLNVELLNSFSVFNYSLVNIFGQEVKSGNIEGTGQINTQGLKSGSYILKVTTSDKQLIKRVIKID